MQMYINKWNVRACLKFYILQYINIDKNTIIVQRLAEVHF